MNVQVFLPCNFIIYFLLVISELSESEGEDRHYLLTQFNKIGPNFTDTNGEPVNVDQELAIEASLHKLEPADTDANVSYK